MSLLSELLGAREPAFTQTVNRLEQESGQPGIDLRLSSDIARKVRLKLRELGLDPSDTKGTELYHGLQNLIKQHDKFLAKQIGVNDSSKAQDVIKQVVKAVKKLPIPRTCWALKHSSAKKLLKQMPPKHIMKQLRYRSVDSLLKRADIDEVFAAIYFAESASWRERFLINYKKLSSSDFESRQINVIELNPKYWADLSQVHLNSSRHNIIKVNELGVVAVLPMPVKHLPGLTITLLPLIIYYVNQLHGTSSFLKLNQVKPNFAATFVKTIASPYGDAATLYGQVLTWDVIHKHYGNLSPEDYPEIFSPHIQPEDLLWKQAEDVLFKLEPALKFWEGLDYVAAPFKNGPVSLSLLDNGVSYLNELEYGEQSSHYFREALKRELFVRYLDQKTLEDEVTNQFDDNLVELETFTIVEKGMR